MNGTNIQNNIGIYITSKLSDNDIHNHFYAEITKSNILPMCIYMSIRETVNANWINDRDQYLMPIPEWEDDKEFQYNCLIYSLFKRIMRHIPPKTQIVVLTKCFSFIVSIIMDITSNEKRN